VLYREHSPNIIASLIVLTLTTTKRCIKEVALKAPQDQHAVVTAITSNAAGRRWSKKRRRIYSVSSQFIL